MIAYPPPGFAFGEPDDKLQAGYPYTATHRLNHLVALEYWITRFRR